MGSLVKARHSIRIADAALIFCALAGAVLIFGGGAEESPAVAAASRPLLHLAIALGAILLVGLAASWLAEIDRRCAEDYVFQLIANGALIGVVTTLFTHTLWSVDFLLGRWLGEPSADAMLGVTMCGWAVGYFTYRLRGLRA